MEIQSYAKHLGRAELPEFTGVRVQMMPFWVHDPFASLPKELEQYRNLVAAICRYADEDGVGFLTVDELELKKGDYHRRPGLHVDCGGPLLAHGSSPRHGGSPQPQPQPWRPHPAAPPPQSPVPAPIAPKKPKQGGMFTVASQLGSQGFVGKLPDLQGEEGDCEHLSRYLGRMTRLEANQLFWCHHMFVHEVLPVRYTEPRQFLRVSMPSMAPWHADYTPNPLGIKPAGPIIGRRLEMQFRR